MDTDGFEFHAGRRTLTHAYVVVMQCRILETVIAFCFRTINSRPAVGEQQDENMNIAEAPPWSVRIKSPFFQ